MAGIHLTEEIRALGLDPFQVGNDAEVVILHTDHAAYESWAPSEIGAAKLVVDCLRFLDSELRPDTKLILLGVGTFGGTRD